MATPDNPGGLRLGRLLGFPVYVDMSLVLIVGILVLFNLRGGFDAFLDGLVFFAVLLVTVMWHELGHALAVRKLDLGESVIVLHGLGGVTRYRSNPTPKQGILVALAGPANGLLLAGVLWALYFLAGASLPAWATQLVYLGAWFNLVVNVANLLPAFPLDGGQVLRFSLMTKLPQARALKITAIVGFVVLAAAAAWLYSVSGFAEIFVWLILALVALENVRLLQSQR